MGHMYFFYYTFTDVYGNHIEHVSRTSKIMDIKRLVRNNNGYLFYRQIY